MRYQIEPMPAWPYPASAAPKPNPFRAKWSDTLELLAGELDHLGVTGAVAMRIVATDADVRLDGMLRANAKVGYRGVVLSFISKHGALSYPCDTFAGAYSDDPPDWQTNVRAIALALEALRKVDRYGVGGHGEQYTGWRAIEASNPMPAFRDAAEAFDWLSRFTGLAMTEQREPTDEDYRSYLREAARKAHPDVGGDPADWVLVDLARQLLLGKGGPS